VEWRGEEMTVRRLDTERIGVGMRGEERRGDDRCEWKGKGN